MLRWIKNRLGITALEVSNSVLSAMAKDNQRLRAIVRDMHEQLTVHRKYVTDKVAELKEYTRVDADVGFRGNNTIILTGVYRKTGFVQFYDMGDGEFEELVKMLKYKKDHCLIRNIDAPPSFRGTFDL